MHFSALGCLSAFLNHLLSYWMTVECKNATTTKWTTLERVLKFHLLKRLEMLFLHVMIHQSHA